MISLFLFKPFFALPSTRRQRQFLRYSKASHAVHAVHASADTLEKNHVLNSPRLTYIISSFHGG